MKEGQSADESLPDLVAYMCTVSDLAKADLKLHRVHRDCERRGAHMIEGFMRCNENATMTYAVFMVFHSECTNKGHNRCRMDKALEKSIIRRWGLLRQQCLFEDELVHMKQEVALELLHAEMRHMKYAHTQVDVYVRKRNELACHIMRRFFAPALIRCLEGAKETMSPGERLLCDFTSVKQLALCRDVDGVFETAAEWLFRVDNAPARAVRCYKCDKPRPSKQANSKDKGVECARCEGAAWFCSVQCQVWDESENVFAHVHECGFQQRKKKRGRCVMSPPM